jgi:hypothetical protein
MAQGQDKQDEADSHAKELDDDRGARRVCRQEMRSE